MPTVEPRPASWFEQTAAALCGLIAQGKFEDARREADPWAAAVREQFGGDSLYGAYADNLVGAILMGLGQLSAAKRVILAGLDTRKRLAGNPSADYADSLRVLAGWYLQAGSVSDARALLECANDILEQLPAPNPAIAAAFAEELHRAWHMEAQHLAQESKFHDALAVARDWLEWQRRRSAATDAVPAAPPLLDLGSLHVQLGEYSLGEHFLTRAERMLPGGPAETSADRARVSYAFGELALLLGRLPETRDRLDLRWRSSGPIRNCTGPTSARPSAYLRT